MNQEFRELRIKAGFPSMSAACKAARVPYRTWQDMEMFEHQSTIRNLAECWLKCLIELNKRKGKKPS